MERIRRRVFILGSGFSASMGLPTLRDLFAGLMAFPERRGESDKNWVRNALEFLYPHFETTSNSQAYPPFEEFLGLVSSAQDFPFFSDGVWQTSYRSSLRLLTDYLAMKSAEAESSSLLREFVSRLDYGDVVITFNWDNLIERSLFAQSKQVSLLRWTSSAVTVLKLHGSLNWVKVPEGVSLKQPDAVTTVYEDVVRTKDFSYYNVWESLNEPPLIVPPIAFKRPLADEFFRELWQSAFDTLLESDQVAFVGYSIPPEDLQARGLLTIGWMTRALMRKKHDRYHLIDPNPEVCGRFAALVGTEINYHQAYFSEEHLSVLFESRDSESTEPPKVHS